MSLLSAKSNLISEIFVTREFNFLRSAKNRLLENKDLAWQVKDYEKKMSEAYGTGNLEAMKNLETEHKRLSSIQEIRAYFEASEAMHNLILNIINDINASIENSLR